MYKSKVLIGCVLLVYILFAFFEAIEQYTVAFYLDSLIIPLITLIYLLFVRRKSRLFSLFLIFFSISDLIGIVTDNWLYYNVSSDEDAIFYEYDYYLGTALYIIAYIFLFVKISQSLCVKHVLRNFKIHLFVLSVLNIYLVYVLQIVVEPHLIYKYEYGFELVYNIVMLLVLSVSLLNFFHKENKKSLFLFIGSLCIVFSEVLDIAYIYIAQRSFINFLGTTLALVAFYFYYQQSKLLYTANEESKYMVAE
ncbi:hypothetical protein L3X39_13690 [Sabulilitoribacter multivorans]|uniref:YhhN-like protein n=1 Tax=Flaviramulus multivorans TaxID=1304750 RepID=A0ABS9IM75_9FLAO|nr:hypothetical protein [Flaviramulus multivorans]MCF7561695.1 hypothetical protein [Flaviramulus multivorans]